MIEKEILSSTDSIYNYKSEDGKTTLGYLEIRLVDGVVDIMSLFVNEEVRRRGIATSLMEHMIKASQLMHSANRLVHLIPKNLYITELLSHFLTSAIHTVTQVSRVSPQFFGSQLHASLLSLL